MNMASRLETFYERLEKKEYLNDTDSQLSALLAKREFKEKSKLKDVGFEKFLGRLIFLKLKESPIGDSFEDIGIVLRCKAKKLSLSGLQVREIRIESIKSA